MTDKPKKTRGARGDGCVRARPAGQKEIWELRYSLGKDATGKRRVVVTTFRGTRADAKKAIRERIGAVDKGQHVDPSTITVSEFVEKWIAFKKDDQKDPVTPKTLERYAELLRRHISPNIGHLKLQKLAEEDIEFLHVKLLKEGRDDGQGLSPQTVRHVHRVLCNALGKAVRWKYLTTNPTAAVKAPKVKTEEVQILSPAELKLVMGGMAEHPVYPVMITALGTGMRRGELLALRWSDIDLNGGEIRVERSLEQTRQGLRIKPPKTKHGTRTIALPSFLSVELRQRWKALQEQRLAMGLGRSNDGLVFGTPVGELRRPDSLAKEWAKAARAIGVKATFHALRHTHASQLIAGGMDVLTVSRRLGHANPTVTLNVYGHLFRNDQQKVVAALDAAFSSVGTD